MLKLRAIESAVKGAAGILAGLIVTRRGLTVNKVRRIRRMYEEGARLARELEEELK